MPAISRRFTVSVLAVLLVALWGSTELAQQQQYPPAARPPAQPAGQQSDQQPADQSSPTIRVDVNLVSFPVTATDNNGRFIGWLRKDDLRLWENNVQQKISVFHSETMPVSMGIVVDTSGSMVNKLPQAIDALDQFVRAIQQDDEVFLMRFSDQVHLMLDFTNDRDLFDRATARLRAGGSTHLYDALDEALYKVRNGRHQKKAIVLITDGEDTSSRVAFEQVLEHARASEVLAYCIGIGERERTGADGPVAGGGGGRRGGGYPSGGTWPGSGGGWPIPGLPIPIPMPRYPGGGYPGGGGRYPGGGGRVGRGDTETVDMRVLEEIADATGGRAYHLQSVGGSGGQDSIDSVTQQISDELRHQYTLGYYSSNPSHDGTYRRIQVAANDPNVQLRYRRGYYAR